LSRDGGLEEEASPGGVEAQKLGVQALQARFADGVAEPAP
jgi:hypothetical protein